MRFFLALILALLAPLAQAKTMNDSFAGRDITVVIPASPARAMLVALHGGGGNARFMQSHLGIDKLAEQNGFIVAYLNGTDAGEITPGRMHAWNSGAGCCGKPVRDKVDDVGYLTNAVAYLQKKYGVAAGQTFVTGHSNGSMMAQRMLCETRVFAAGVTMSGPLAPGITQCAGAKGVRILALHGEVDENVPLAGGKGTKGPMRVQRDVQFNSEAAAKQVFEAWGASYTLQVVPGADHSLKRIDEVLVQQGTSLGESITRFLGLTR